MTKRLVSTHAELIGNEVVEPGAEFDESNVDSDLLARLESEGKLGDVAKAPAKEKS